MVRTKAIYLFRHGQTYFNRHKYFTGWKNSRVTPEGRRQTEKIAQALRGKHIDVGVQSELGRCCDTLQQVLRFHPETTCVITDNRIIERSYGDLEGKAHATIKKKFGEAQYQKWHRGYTTPPPNGESFAMVEKRVRSFVRDLKAQIRHEEINVAISGHGNSIRIFRKIWEGASREEAVQWTIPYDKFFTYQVALPVRPSPYAKRIGVCTSCSVGGVRTCRCHGKPLVVIPMDVQRVLSLNGRACIAFNSLAVAAQRRLIKKISATTKMSERKRLVATLGRTLRRP